jgi:serine/threonine protein kinase
VPLTTGPSTFLDETGVSIIVCGIVLGMRFIHSQGAMHRDLKPENILHDENEHMMISDLGRSRFDDLCLTLTSQVDCPRYMAPEMSDDSEYIPRLMFICFVLFCTNLWLVVLFLNRQCRSAI